VSAISHRRRTEELGLGILALVIVISGYLLLSLSEAPSLPPGLWAFAAAILGLFVIAHLAVRRFARNADATLLPLVAADQRQATCRQRAASIGRRAGVCYW